MVVVVVVFLPFLLPPLEEWEASCQPKAETGPLLPPSPEEKPTMRLCRGAQHGDAGCCANSDHSQKGGFTSVGAWTGLCFGEGEVPLWVTAPGTFSSFSHLNRVDFSRRRMSPSSKRLPWVPLSFCGSPGKRGAGCLLPQPPRHPAGVQEAVGEALLLGRLGTERADRSPVPLSLPGVVVTVAELFQAMLQWDFWL